MGLLLLAKHMHSEYRIVVKKFGGNKVLIFLLTGVPGSAASAGQRERGHPKTKFLGNRKSHIVQDFKEPSFIFVDTSNQQWCPNNQFKLLEKRLLYKRHERPPNSHSEE
ncbi:unnamed protein product [Caretta caretta]